MIPQSSYRAKDTKMLQFRGPSDYEVPPVVTSWIDPRTGEPSPTRCAPLHADGRAGIKRDTNGDPLVPLPKRAKPKGQREAESRRRGNAASAKARGKRGARL